MMKAALICASIATAFSAGIATIVGLYLTTQPHSDDATIVANTGIASIAAVWIIVVLIFMWMSND